jgi:hypothetical protein
LVAILRSGIKKRQPQAYDCRHRQHIESPQIAATLAADETPGTPPARLWVRSTDSKGHGVAAPAGFQNGKVDALLIFLPASSDFATANCQLRWFVEDLRDIDFTAKTVGVSEFERGVQKIERSFVSVRDDYSPYCWFAS